MSMGHVGQVIDRRDRDENKKNPVWSVDQSTIWISHRSIISARWGDCSRALLLRIVGIAFIVSSCWQETKNELCLPPTSFAHPGGWFVKQFRSFSIFLPSCWPTRDHIGRITGISNPAWHLLQVVPRLVRPQHRFHARPAYTAKLLTLHQHRANIQHRTANQI